jgi:acylphosphatase
MKARAHVFVSGRVQGVFFRSETRREATRRGVIGWVRNLHDGRVEAIFEGEEESVKALVEFCRHGSPDAIVTGIEVKWEDFRGEYRGFETIYR